MKWPPDYRSVFEFRQRQLLKIRSNPVLLVGAKEYYRTRPVEFIEHFCSTYDPRHAGRDDKMTTMPFVLFKRQRELVEFVYQCLRIENHGLIEKARDMGATWVACAISVHLWLFIDEAAIGWGSRKQELVDELGMPDSIFEKIRILIRNLPRELLPKGFDYQKHMPFMRIINPENGATISGEIGDNIGRGGRKLAYWCDESAHYQHPELIEAALSANTRVQIDISSVNGLGNVFHRKREAGVEWQPGEPMVRGKTAVFVMDWRDHPEKTEEWYEREKARKEDQGLGHIFAQEVDRNYASALHGTIIKLDWIRAALAYEPPKDYAGGRWIGALDVADEGGDKNALTIRKGIVAKDIQHWGEGDTGMTTRRAIKVLRETCGGQPVEFQYDAIGVGAGVKAEAARLVTENLMPAGVRFVPWRASAKPLFPEKRIIPGDKASMLNEDYFANLRAQAWFQVARMFERTYRHVKEGREYPPDELISLAELRNHPLIRQLEKELAQVTQGLSPSTLKMTINKKPDGTFSPNLADSFVECYWPVVSGAPSYSAASIGGGGR